MDPTMSMPTGMPRGAPSPFMPHPQMMQMGAGRSPFLGVAPLANPIEANQKMNEFSRGIYVSGFEKTLTAAMLQEHFKIKPITGLKLPLSKFNENKGFAFIYYQNPDDAAYVKQKLDYSVILKNKIRVTKTVIAENLSKMMFKLKRGNMTEDEIKQVKARTFNEKSLEAEVNRIIQPLLGNFVEVNKIVIPVSKSDKNKTLDYARGFFYVNNVKGASEAIKNQMSQSSQDNTKNYELVLSYIADKLNSHPEFSRYVKAEIYEYSKKNQSNVLHIKNINAKSDEDPAKIAEQLKNFIQDQNKQASIKGCYVGLFSQLGAWANIVFGTYEETVKAYEHFKNNRIKFRDNFIYANLRNVKDLRTVVISTVKKDATQTQMREFLNRLAEGSNKLDANDETKGRKYDFASFNIIEQKTFYIDHNHHSIGLTEQEKPDLSWRENNTVPRRVVVHFMNDIEEKDLRQLLIDIKLMKGWEQVFFEKDSKNTIRANHQKGHIKDNAYVRHNDLHRKKAETQVQAKQKQQRPKTDARRNSNEQTYNSRLNRLPGVPRAPTHQQGRTGGAMIRPHQPPISTKPIGQIGGIPSFGGQLPGKIGSIPNPNMPIPQIGGMNRPPVIGGNPMGVLPPMGGMPPMGLTGIPPMGISTMPQMGMPPPMGGMQVPQMGASKMGGNLPPQDKKQ